METRSQTAIEWFLAELLKDGARNISLDGLAALTEEALAMENEMKFTSDDMILFMTWVRENDTMENGERWFGYTNQDMLKEWVRVEKSKEF